MNTGNTSQASEKMPLLFVGHGNPMNAIEENSFVEGFRRIVNDIPRPRAILCISAHWYTSGTRVTAMENPRTIHDFMGFPRQLYEVQYPAKGNPELAAEVQRLLLPTVATSDESWGLDHGTWSVAKHMYPDADVPIVQLSIDRSKQPSYHYDLGNRLRSLRKEGILIVGSGNIIHNLALVDFQYIDKSGYGYDWAIRANEIIHDHLSTGNDEALVDYKNQPDAMQLAIPTPDHYLPFIYILGIREQGERITLFNDEMVGGSLSMTSLLVH